MALNQRERDELDRYITGNYGEDSVAQEGCLCGDCEAILEERGWHSTPDRLNQAGSELRDEEGTLIARVSKAISAYDLRALVSWGNKQYERGMSHGRIALQSQLRSLLNAAPNELDDAA